MLRGLLFLIPLVIVLILFNHRVTRSSTEFSFYFFYCHPDDRRGKDLEYIKCGVYVLEILRFALNDNYLKIVYKNSVLICVICGELKVAGCKLRSHI